jgi:predicted dehydrogenase
MSETRVAVIGCGYQGRAHVESLRKLPDVRVVAVCDLNDERAAEVAALHDVPSSYSDYRDLLAGEPELDLVTVCTMPDTHREIVIGALSFGANVLCEKPFARHLQEGLEMADAAAAAGRLLTVGFNMRHMTASTAVRRFVETGALGTPICARGWMLANDVPWWGRHYERAVSGGGALASTAVHMIDLVRWLAGNPIPTTATASMATIFPRKRSVAAPVPDAAATYDVEDIVFGHVRFAGGFWLSIEASWVWDDPGGGWNYSFDLVGDRAQARLDPLTFTRETGDGQLEQVASGTVGDVSFPDSIDREIADVVAAVREGRPALGRVEDALYVQAIVDALYASAAAGHEVAIDTTWAARSG